MAFTRKFLRARPWHPGNQPRAKLFLWTEDIEHSVEHVYTVYTCHTLQFCDMQTSAVHNMVSFASTSRNTEVVKSSN